FGLISLNCGLCSCSSSSIHGIRGAKRQESLSILFKGGTTPSMTCNLDPCTSSLGKEFNRDLVYGCFGSLNNSLAGPISTSCPAYISSTLSAISATVPKSLVISKTPEFKSSCNSLIKSKI